MSKRDKTLKDVLDIILYENPSTQDEIAEKLGLPLGTVKSRIFFTRQRLQSQLHDFIA